MKDRGSDPKLKAMLEAIENNTKKNDSDEQPEKEYTYAESQRIYAVMNSLNVSADAKSAEGVHQPGE